ncbi:hypothetical protein [Streptomyces sp. NPDC088775]|uniref:hypothetical protein n=1 Tax=Streptomyces sp. NPDC088775 TaxID=3365896 RepID=UPI00382C7D7F
MVSLLHKKTYVNPGDTVLMRIGYSEVAVHMRVADKVMPVRVTETDYPMAQILADYENNFGGAITLGEAGLYTDREGIYSDAITLTHVRWAPTATSGRFYVLNPDGTRVPSGYHLFEEARDTARRIGGEVRLCDTRSTPPFWAHFMPVSLDADVRHTRNGDVQDAYIHDPDAIEPHFFGGRRHLQEG